MPHKNVIIKAPPALLPKVKDGRYEPPSPEELCSILDSQVKIQQEKIQGLEVTLETIANVACSLVFILIDMGYQVMPSTIGIPKETSDRMKGAKLKINEDKDRNVIVSLEERGSTRLHAT